jgi:hypothetical protein
MLAPVGKSGLQCTVCHDRRFLSLHESIRLSCKVCHSGQKDLKLAIQVRDSPILTSWSSEAQSRDWWHFSLRPVGSWPAPEGVVHLGSSLDAAILRAGNSERKYRSSDDARSPEIASMWFYRIRLPATLTVTDDVYIDNVNADTRDLDDLVAPGQALRYVNLYENAGSISVIVRVEDIVVDDYLQIPFYRNDINKLTELTT